jgi:hypothetical protein
VIAVVDTVLDACVPEGRLARAFADPGRLLAREPRRDPRRRSRGGAAGRADAARAAFRDVVGVGSSPGERRAPDGR